MITVDQHPRAGVVRAPTQLCSLENLDDMQGDEWTDWSDKEAKLTDADKDVKMLVHC